MKRGIKMMTLSEFNASLPKKEDDKSKKIDFYKETLEICQRENVELRKMIKYLLDYIKEGN